MPEIRDFYFPSTNGKNKILARICTPDKPPKAVVQIAHGIAEHISRYDPFMFFLAENGYVAVGNDHLGHGLSAENEDGLGIFDTQNGWTYAVDDMKALRDQVRQEFHDIPYIFFGHSMGSFLTRTYLIRYPDQYDAAILSGTGQQSPALINAGFFAANLLTLLRGPGADGKLLNDMAFGSYCKKIDNPRTPFDWLSTNEENVDRYIADPLCGFVAKCSMYRDMMGGLKFLTKQSNIDKMNKDAPIYFMSGAEDPVGDYGAGVEKAYRAFCDAGLHDVTMKLYPGGRHEMLNETNREEVMQDILAWLDQRVDSL
ncbi:MAG: alpha/beta hydrolase [Oscillospiraceae bacterium]|nr:alpha/beta hydrolase [Oscillospiraceae bacterium]MBR2702896.1 alpha/beta hydrolase [Oscillospiraceae bacterium]MBR4551494.1 alpha/beta hydrolase [Oscillospiraceae bacterium]